MTSVATQGAEVAVQLQGDSTAQHHDLAVVAEGGVFADFPPFSSASADMSIKGYDIECVEAAHAAGLLVSLHVCGRATLLLEDLAIVPLLAAGQTYERHDLPFAEPDGCSLALFARKTSAVP